jgi:hypothetical protein
MAVLLLISLREIKPGREENIPAGVVTSAGGG